MAEYIDNTICLDQDFLQLFTSPLSASTALSYSKALRSFSAFAGDDYASLGRQGSMILGDWFVDMVINGMSIKTASHYLDSLCSILKNASLRGRASVSSDTLADIKKRVREFRKNQDLVSVTDSDFSSLRSMIRTSAKLTGELSTYTDLATLTLLEPGLDLLKSCLLKKDSLDHLTPASREIAQRQISSRRSYLFPLQQGEKTSGQIYRRANDKILSLLRYHNLPVMHSSQASLANLWASVALRSGRRASIVAASLGDLSQELPLLRIATPADIGSHEIRDVYKAIQDTLISNPPLWHVMHLRQGVRYATLRNRLEINKTSISISSIFYPEEEIAMKIGKRVVSKNKPLIPGIVFIKTGATETGALMRHAGDLAWLMRDRSRRDCPYAVIPQTSMDLFQQVIGQFTADSRLYPLGTLTLKPEDRVIIIGGDYSGTEAVVEKVPKDTDGDIIYQVRFIDDTGFEWHIPKDQRLLRKL